MIVFPLCPFSLLLDVWGASVPVFVFCLVLVRLQGNQTNAKRKTRTASKTHQLHHQASPFPLFLLSGGLIDFVCSPCAGGGARVRNSTLKKLERVRRICPPSNAAGREDTFSWLGVFWESKTFLKWHEEPPNLEKTPNPNLLLGREKLCAQDMETPWEGKAPNQALHGLSYASRNGKHCGKGKRQTRNKKPEPLDFLGHFGYVDSVEIAFEPVLQAAARSTEILQQLGKEHDKGRTALAEGSMHAVRDESVEDKLRRVPHSRGLLHGVWLLNRFHTSSAAGVTSFQSL